MTTITSPNPLLARTPLLHWHLAHGAQCVNLGGWHVPTRYSSIEQELAAVSSGVGLIDCSAFRKTNLTGPGVPQCARYFAGDGRLDQVHSVVRVAGQESMIACRLAEQHILLLWDTVSQRLQAAPFLEPPISGVEPRDVTSRYAGCQLIGPNVVDVLRRLTSFDVSRGWQTAGLCVETSIAGVYGIIVQVEELALPAWRVYVSWDVAEYVWQSIVEAGRGLGMSPVGLETLRELYRKASGVDLSLEQ